MNISKWFRQHLLNHLHWIWMRLDEHGPIDPIHKHIMCITQVGIKDLLDIELAELEREYGFELDID